MMEAVGAQFFLISFVISFLSCGCGHRGRHSLPLMDNCITSFRLQPACNLYLYIMYINKYIFMYRRRIIVRTRTTERLYVYVLAAVCPRLMSTVAGQTIDDGTYTGRWRGPARPPPII